MKKLASAFGVELNETFKIQDSVGDYKFTETGTFRRSFMDNPWIGIGRIIIDVEKEIINEKI